MKKAYLTITASLTFATITNALIRYGVKAGASFATIRTVHADAGDEDETTDTTTGFNGGGFVTIPVSSPSVFSP
jgi:hypothetical protein